VENQPGPLANEPFTARGSQLPAALGRASVLPDQRPMHRLAAVRVPGDDGLALVGDADALELGPGDAGGGDRLRRDPPRRLPDLGRVVLDPPGAGKVLLELGVRPPHDPGLAVEDEAGGTGGALVDGEDHRACGYPASTWAPR